MTTWEPQAATAVIGLAAFQLWTAWQDNAPSIADLRKVMPGDDDARQQLMDAELTVGSLALIIGVAFAVLTKDLTALIIMLSVFGALAFMHHWILDGNPH